MGETSCAVAFTTSWLLFLPLDPPPQGSARHEAWRKMPPPPPCALCGLVVCPAVPKDFPETAGLQSSASVATEAKTVALVSTRAAEEGIREGSAEYEAALREVRIASQILGQPPEIVGVWAFPAGAS